MDVESRLAEIEIKLSFSENLLDELNRTVFRQQQEINALQQALRDLRSQVEANAPAEPLDQREEVPALLKDGRTRMLERLKAITLDLDDTLWPSAPAIAAAEAKLHAWLEREAPAMAAALPPPEFMRFRRALAAEMPHIAHDFTATRHEALKRALVLHGADPGLSDAAMDLFLRERSTVELYPDVDEALERLSKRYCLVALSNGNADLERISVGRFFACVVNARSAGFAKPDSRIFHAACARADARAGEVLHAGDDPDLDVRAALRAGVNAAWINRTGKAWDGEPASHDEFPDLLALCERLGA